MTLNRREARGLWGLVPRRGIEVASPMYLNRITEREARTELTQAEEAYLLANAGWQLIVTPVSKPIIRESPCPSDTAPVRAAFCGSAE